MASPTSIRQTVSRLTNAMTSGQPEAEIDACRAALATEKIAYHIEKVLADAPPLSEEQRVHLGHLLAGGADK